MSNWLSHDGVIIICFFRVEVLGWVTGTRHCLGGLVMGLRLTSWIFSPCFGFEFLICKMSGFDQLCKVSFKIRIALFIISKKEEITVNTESILNGLWYLAEALKGRSPQTPFKQLDGWSRSNALIFSWPT